MTIPEEIKYLYSIKSVRETNLSTLELIKNNKLINFNVNLNNIDNVVNFVIETIKSTYPTNDSLLTIPIHGRFQHFNKGNENRLPDLINNEFKKKMGLNDEEICKKLIDLFVISVLLDAGAGNNWKYIEKESGLLFNRSEGIAIATFHMFINGVFSNNENGDDKYRVDGNKLSKLTGKELSDGLQISEMNPINGFEGRLKLLNKLGETLVNDDEIFKSNRPGDLVDYLNLHCDEGKNIEIEILWDVLMKLLIPIWPTEGRTKIDNYLIGDAWPLKNKNDKIVTFHKLTQWLTYSLFKPLIEFGKFKILNSQYMTGLPEYRNGGLFIDFNVISLKDNEHNQNGIKLGNQILGLNNIPVFKPDDDVIIEWRSITINLLDYLLPIINEKMGIKGSKYELSLPQLIEAGSWKSGRLIASKLRSNGGPPIELLGDGTVF